MKRIYLLLAVLACCLSAFSQTTFPINQYLGAPNTLITSRGGMKADSALVIPSFADTAKANISPYLNKYPGNIIRVNDILYMRDKTATKWIALATVGQGGTVTQINQGYAIVASPNPITTTGVIAVDTSVLNTLYLKVGDTITPNLQQVTNVGNTTTKDVFVNQLGIYDSTNMTHNWFKGIENGYTLYSGYDSLGIFQVERKAIAIFDTGSNYGALYFNGLTGTRMYRLPDSSGTIALNQYTIDSLKRIPGTDSIFARKNGQWVFQYKDSTGGGGSQNLQQVTDIGDSTTNNIYVYDYSNNNSTISASNITSANLSGISQTQSEINSVGAFIGIDINTITNYKKSIIVAPGAITYSEDSLSAFLPNQTAITFNIPNQQNVIKVPDSSGTIALKEYVIDSLKRNSGTDSVFARKNGQWIFQYRDSIGTGGAGGGGGGKIYYLNGGVNLGTFAGVAMYELGDTAVVGTAANFTRSLTGNIANFITDVNKPGLLQIPAGVWTVDAFLSETGGGSNHAQIYAKLEIWNGTSLTTVATSPVEEITNGNVPDLYTYSISVPTTALSVTDRIVIQFYIQNTNGKTVTLYTQNGYVGEVHTTFTTGIGALNGLTAPSQTFATGTSGTDFNIVSAVSTHTFNLPTANGTTRGALSSTDWTTFNNKLNTSDTATMLSPYARTNSVNASLATKLNISDTATMLSPYLISNTASATYLAKSDSSTYYTKYRSDTSRTNIYSAINGKQNQLNGTGFVKASGTTISYDNSTYLLASSYDYLLNTAYQALGSTIKGFNLAVPTITNATTSLALTSQQMRVVAYYLPQAATITGVKYYSVTGGVYTGNNYNGVGLYTYSGGTLTLVASTTNDANFWTPTQGWVTKPFSSTYSAAAGIYYIGFIYSNSAQTTAPSIGVATAANSNGFQTVDFTNSAKIQGALSTQTSLPSSSNISSFSANTGNPLMLLY